MQISVKSEDILLNKISLKNTYFPIDQALGLKFNKVDCLECNFSTQLFHKECTKAQNIFTGLKDFIKAV